jgi:hypothetical protein
MAYRADILPTRIQCHFPTSTHIEPLDAESTVYLTQRRRCPFRIHIYLHKGISFINNIDPLSAGAERRKYVVENKIKAKNRHNKRNRERKETLHPLI